MDSGLLDFDLALTDSFGTDIDLGLDLEDFLGDDVPPIDTSTLTSLMFTVDFSYVGLTGYEMVTSYSLTLDGANGVTIRIDDENMEHRVSTYVAHYLQHTHTHEYTHARTYTHIHTNKYTVLPLISIASPQQSLPNIDRFLT